MKKRGIWGLIFFVFLFFSFEDRLFKNWKGDLGEFVSCDNEIREWTRVNLFSGATILIDIPEWKDWDKPFANKGLGNVRRSLYRKAFPQSVIQLKRLFPQASMPRLVRLNSRKRFREDEKTSLLKLTPEGSFSPQGLKTLVLSQNIDRPSSLRKDLDKIEPSQRTRPSERGEKVKAEQNASIHF